MDNLTHTLIGTLVGETFSRATSSSEPGLTPMQRRNLLVAVAAVSSNLPDIDFVQSAITGSKLDYLLQHRGYTHTVIGTLVAGIVMLLACEAWCRWRHWTISSNDRVQLGVIALLTLLLHIAMDFTNSYGVHPFWPFYNGWLYGDSIFIVEPLLWAAAVPLIVLLRTRTARVLVALALLAGIGLGFGSGMVPPIFAVTMTALYVAMLIVSYRAKTRTALVVALTLWVAVTATFAVSRSVASRQIAALASAQWPEARLLDNALTPMPADPVCWDAMLVMSQGDRYLIRHATWSIAPSLIAASECPARLQNTAITAPVVPIRAANSSSVQWRGELDMPRDQIAQLASTNCEAAAFMRFSRVPFSMQRSGGWLIGDLRYDLEPGLGFAEFELTQRELTQGSARCPRHVPGWLPPREDLLK